MFPLLKPALAAGESDQCCCCRHRTFKGCLSVGEAHRQLRNEVYNHSGQGVRAFCQTQKCLRVSQSVVLSVSQPVVIQSRYEFQLGHAINFNWGMSA